MDPRWPSGCWRDGQSLRTPRGRTYPLAGYRVHDWDPSLFRPTRVEAPCKNGVSPASRPLRGDDAAEMYILCGVAAGAGKGLVTEGRSNCGP